VKTGLARFNIHATFDAAESLAHYLRDRYFVDVLSLPATSSLRSQIQLLQNYSHVVLPGGGEGFLAMLAPFGMHIIAAYHLAEQESLLSARCYARISIASHT